MNKNIQFQNNKNIVSLVCPQFVIFDAQSLLFLNSLEKDSKVKELLIELKGCNFNDHLQIDVLLDLLKKFIGIEKLKIIIGFDNKILISQFQYLAKNISNLQNLKDLKDLSLMFDTNVLDLDQETTKQLLQLAKKKFEEVKCLRNEKSVNKKTKEEFLKSEKIKKLELSINKSNSNTNVELIIYTFILESFNAQNLKLEIKDHKLNQQQFEQICTDLSYLSLLESAQFSITNNEEPIQYQQLMKIFHSKKLACIDINLENCVVNFCQQNILELGQNHSLKRINLNYNNVQNINFIIQDLIQSLNNMLALEDLKITVEQCNIEDLEIFTDKNVNKLKLIQIKLLKSNIASKAYLSLLQFISNKVVQIKNVDFFFNTIQMKLECQDQSENKIILDYENSKSQNLQSLAQEISSFFKLVKDVPTIKLRIFGPLQYGFKFNENSIQQLTAEVLNCQENFLFFQVLIKSFDFKALEILKIDFKFTQKVYDQKTNELENNLMNLLNVKQIYLQFDKTPSFSRGMIALLSKLLKQQITQIEATFELDNLQEEEEKIYQDISHLAESMHNVKIIDIKFQLDQKYLLINAKNNLKESVIKLKIYLKKYSMYLLSCFIYSLFKIKGLENAFIQISETQYDIIIKMDELEYISLDNLNNFEINDKATFFLLNTISNQIPIGEISTEDSSLQINNNINDKCCIFNVLLNHFTYLKKANNISVDLKNFQISKLKTSENFVQSSHFQKFKCSKANPKNVYNFNMQIPYRVDTYNFVVQQLSLINNKYLQTLNLNFLKNQEISKGTDCVELEGVISNFEFSNTVCLELQNAPSFSESFILYFSKLIQQNQFSVKAIFNLNNQYQNEEVLIGYFKHIFLNFQLLNQFIILDIFLYDKILVIKSNSYKTGDQKSLNLQMTCKNGIQKLILNLLKGKCIKNSINLNIYARSYEFKILLNDNQDKNYIQNERSNLNEQNYISTNSEYDLLDIILQYFNNPQPIADIFQQVFLHSTLESFEYDYYYTDRQIQYYM
ncbi:hypothetical protein ABPG74_020668 [Tetrahymena malaccensis]